MNSPLEQRKIRLRGLRRRISGMHDEDERRCGDGGGEDQVVEDEGVWLGYLLDYPDYWTQGTTFDDLQEHLGDLHRDLRGGQRSPAMHVEDLIV